MKLFPFSHSPFKDSHSDKPQSATCTRPWLYWDLSMHLCAFWTLWTKLFHLLFMLVQILPRQWSTKLQRCLAMKLGSITKAKTFIAVKLETCKMLTEDTWKNIDFVHSLVELVHFVTGFSLSHSCMYSSCKYPSCVDFSDCRALGYCKTVVCSQSASAHSYCVFSECWSGILTVLFV